MTNPDPTDKRPARDRPVAFQGVEITPEMRVAAIRWLREEFYPCAWGSETASISEAEAEALIVGVLNSLERAREQG